MNKNINEKYTVGSVDREKSKQELTYVWTGYSYKSHSCRKSSQLISTLNMVDRKI